MGFATSRQTQRIFESLKSAIVCDASILKYLYGRGFPVVSRILPLVDVAVYVFPGCLPEDSPDTFSPSSSCNDEGKEVLGLLSGTPPRNTYTATSTNRYYGITSANACISYRHWIDYIHNLVQHGFHYK
jgi:hypothetical protein